MEANVQAELQDKPAGLMAITAPQGERVLLAISAGDDQGVAVHGSTLLRVEAAVIPRLGDPRQGQELAQAAGQACLRHTKRVDRRAVMPPSSTWKNQKGEKSGASFPATGPAYVTVATSPPSRKGSQIRTLGRANTNTAVHNEFRGFIRLQASVASLPQDAPLPRGVVDPHPWLAEER